LLEYIFVFVVVVDAVVSPGAPVADPLKHPLAAKVPVGAYLVAVDDQDVTRATIYEVVSSSSRKRSVAEASSKVSG
jgi:hypothetical protein